MGFSFYIRITFYTMPLISAILAILFSSQYSFSALYVELPLDYSSIDGTVYHEMGHLQDYAKNLIFQQTKKPMLSLLH